MTNLKTIAAIALSGIFAVSLNTTHAQEKAPDSTLLKIYRATPPKINDLIHTKLDVHFDYKKRYMYGKEWVTLNPIFILQIP